MRLDRGIDLQNCGDRIHREILRIISVSLVFCAAKESPSTVSSTIRRFPVHKANFLSFFCNPIGRNDVSKALVFTLFDHSVFLSTMERYSANESTHHKGGSHPI